MRRNKLEVYIHFVWRTWDSQPLLTERLSREIYRLINAEIQKQGCDLLALDGIPDHVHLLVKFTPVITIAEFVKQIKGGSAQAINQTYPSNSPFKWQGGYGAFSVSYWDVEEVQGYIRNQQQHHRDNSIVAAYEAILEDDE